MKKFILTSAICHLTFYIAFSQGTWIQKASLPLAPALPCPGRLSAVAFSIGGKGYLGTGYGVGPNFTCTNSPSLLHEDFWEYDPVADTWTQKANFGGGVRWYAIGFSIGNKGYVGTGVDTTGGGTQPSDYYNDLWEYDPVANTWTALTNCPGVARATACAFSVGGFGYIGTGVDGNGAYLQDMWKYDPANNTWTQANNFPGGVRSDIDRAPFVIGSKAYLGTGWDGNTEQNDFWEYDYVTDAWVQKANFPGIARIGATGFSICNKGFLCLGGYSPPPSTTFNDVWMYDPGTNSWSPATTFPGGTRVDAPSFVINDKAYIGTGYSLISIISKYWDDLWEFSISGASITAASNTTVCLGGTATLTAFGGNSYSWSNGQTASSIVVAPSATTSYTVTGIGSCGSGTASVTVTIVNSITVAAGPSSTICSGQTATLTASGGTPYFWNTGATTSSIVVSPTVNSSYTVVVGSGSCSDTAFAAVTVSSSIIAAAGPASTICPGGTVTLSASGGTPYSWNTGATASSIIVSPTGTANYSVIVGSGSCSDTASVTVTVANNITAAVASSSTICPGGIVTLTASGGTNYSWTTGATTPSVIVSPTATVTYSAVVSSGICSDTASATVTVVNNIIASAANATICSGQTATLTASGGGNYSWSNAASTSSATVSPTSTSTYSVIVSIGNCSDTASATVSVNPSPAVSVSGNTTLCIGDIATLTASGGNNYSWSTGQTTSSITAAATATATYSVTASNGNCTSTTSITVVVSPPPTAAANNVTICDGQTATLTASGGTNYSWSNGSSTSSATVSPASTSGYSVIVSIGSCSDTASATVTVDPSPTASAFSNVTITEGQSTTLSASGGGTYSWSPATGLSCTTCSNPTATPPFGGQGGFIYCVTVTQDNCSDTACVTVTVEPIDCSYDDDQLFIPDAFSPNGDTKNDKLGVYYPNPSCIKEFMLIIYDRWGEKVFETTDQKICWDGTYKGKLMNTAVFVYYMKVTFIDGNETIKKGNISLIQ